MNDQRAAITLRRVSAFLFLLAAGMFGLTILELILLRHWDGTQVIPLIACGVGIIALAVAWFAASDTMSKAVRILMALIVVSGVVGTIIHADENNEGGEGGDEAFAPTSLIASTAPIAPSHVVRFQDDDDEGERGGEEAEGTTSGSVLDRILHGEAPLLAPLALTGAGVTGFVAVMVQDDLRRSAQTATTHPGTLR